MSTTPECELVHDRKAAFRIRVVPNRELRFEHLDWPSQKLRGQVTLPYPRSGYGGAVLSLAADHAAVLLYSGQSETGYELFSLTPEFRHVGGMAYRRRIGSEPHHVFTKRPTRRSGGGEAGALVDRSE